MDTHAIFASAAPYERFCVALAVLQDASEDSLGTICHPTQMLGTGSVR
jgi:hypothetical protein